MFCLAYYGRDRSLYNGEQLLHAGGVGGETHTRSQETQQRAVNVVAVSFFRHHEMNHPEVATLNEQRAARRRQGQLLHGCYMMMQNLDREREKKKRNKGKTTDVV